MKKSKTVFFEEDVVNLINFHVAKTGINPIEVASTLSGLIPGILSNVEMDGETDKKEEPRIHLIN